MICEKCLKEYDEGLGACPHCQEKTAEKSFKVTIPEEEPQEPQKPRKKGKKPVKHKPSASERLSRNVVIALACLVAVITAAAAVTGIATDIFKAPDDVKAVAVLILPAEDKKELQKHLEKLGPLAETGFDTEYMTSGELIGHIRPYSPNGLYQSFGYSAEAVTQEPDPALRYGDEQGNYNYYKIPAEEIDSILEQFDLPSDHALNGEDCYYYDGSYYFSSGEASQEAVRGEVTVEDSKRIQDGRYYVTCTLDGIEVYVTASIMENGEESYWKIHSMSTEPMFDDLGLMIKDDSDEEYEYEMCTEIIEATAEDGTVFRKYVLKYPRFFGESQGEIQANGFYSNIVSYYRQQASQAESEYKKFIKNKGEEGCLPIELHYTAQMSYGDEDYLCLVNEVRESLATYDSKTSQENTATQGDTEAVPAELSAAYVECNTFDAETGLFLSKDELLGKDYITIAQVLYRIYEGYDCSGLFSEDISEDIPEDEDELGEAIYDSAGTLSKEGFAFWYTGKGYAEKVVIPFEIIQKLTQEQ